MVMARATLLFSPITVDADRLVRSLSSLETKTSVFSGVSLNAPAVVG